MANTYVDFTATAAQTDFAFSFPYLEDSHVVVEIDGVKKTLTTDYTIVTSPAVKVVLTSGATVGQKVRVRRDSNADSDNPLVDFVNGSVLTESSLDRSYLHNLYLNEEIGELNQLSLQKEVAGTEWDAKSLRITNVADPTGVQDAGTKNYVDTQISNKVTGSSTESAKYTFTGDGVNAAFTFSPGITLSSDNMYEVAIDGVLQEPTAAYAINADANTITFSGVPPNTSNIVVVQRGYAVPATSGTQDVGLVKTTGVAVYNQDSTSEGGQIMLNLPVETSGSFEEAKAFSIDTYKDTGNIYGQGADKLFFRIFRDSSTPQLVLDEDGVIVVTGQFRLSGLPTSSAGLTSGYVWNNSGVLTIV